MDNEDQTPAFNLGVNGCLEPGSSSTQAELLQCQEAENLSHAGIQAQHLSQSLRSQEMAPKCWVNGTGARNTDKQLLVVLAQLEVNFPARM